MICFNNNVFFDGCTLKADDFTMYPPGTGVLEFVAYVKHGVSTISAKSIKISTDPSRCSYRYQPEVDGRYMYYKIVLPVFDNFDDPDNIVNIPLGYFIGTYGCKKIICLNENNSVSLSDTGDSIEVTQVNDMLSILNSGLVSDIEMKEFFSICNLNNCVAKLQKQYILSHADDCGSTVCKKGSDSNKANRDFLFIASYLLDHYIAKEDFDQAEELLDTIRSCGNLLCKDHDNLNSCGCNG